MARFIPKQFAENSTTSVVFGSHQEQGGHVGDGTISSDPATLQGGAAWPLGWSAATDNFFEIPRGEEMEGLERVLSAAIIQQFKDGLTFWQSEMPVTQYQTIVQYQTGSDLPKLYVNITGTSTSTPPDSDTANWFMFFDTAQVSANIALTNSPYTTNRILEIPQDIKLELNNGTLTLKAGSKVYVPNGFESDGTTPKFDIITTTSDLTKTTDTQSLQTDLLYLTNNNVLDSRRVGSMCFSGPTAPTGNQYMLWYDTANNLMKRTDNSGSTWTSSQSLPIAQITSTGGAAWTSIDQIFNGFGYIGSTVFALPGVKVQAPNGINANRTYNSSVYTIGTVYTITIDAGWGTFDMYLAPTELGKWPNVISGSVGTRYNSENNYYEVYDQVNSRWVPLPQRLVFAKLKADTTSPYKITSFTPYTVDSVANSNLSNLTNGLANTICTTPATTTSTASYATPAVVVENYRNGASFYRKWSDGFIEQGGIAAAGYTSTVSFFVAFSSTNYVVEVTAIDNTSTGYIYSAYNRTTVNMILYTAPGGATTNCAKSWYACGY